MAALASDRSPVGPVPWGALRDLVGRRRAGALAVALFRVRLSPGQAAVARAIAWREHPRICVVAHTRYGKTFAVAVGVALLLLVDPRPLKIRLVAPTLDQAGILRGYLVDLVLRCPPLAGLLDVDATGLERLRKEVSKRRLTFRDGKDVLILSAEGAADRLLGWGGDVVVLDESGLLPQEVYEGKVSRMLADSPESTLVEIGNPWHRDSHFYRHWGSPRFRRVHIPWQVGVREGRVSRAFVEEQREELAPLLFQVLWDAAFPDAAEGQLIPWSWIERAFRAPGVSPEDPHTLQRWGLDVARGGGDKTVLTRLLTLGDRHDAARQWRWDLADTEAVADAVDALLPRASAVAVDAVGVGAGVADKLRRRGHHVAYVTASERASTETQRKRLRDRKAEAFWILRSVLEADRLRIPDTRWLRADLTRYRYKLDGGRVAVYEEGGKSPGNSPDHGDSLAYAFLAKPKAPKPKYW